MHWIVLTPPLITISIAYLTRRVHLALLSGIIAAGLIVTDGNVLQTATLVMQRIWQTTQLDNILTGTQPLSRFFILLFLLVLGCVISLIETNGSVYAYGQFFKEKIRTAQQAQYASLLLSILLFIDDYLSNLMTGSVIRPITDRFSIAHAKLAFLVNCMAAPVTILVPVSSWVAEITTQFATSGINQSEQALVYAQPFATYIATIPYVWYSIILIVSVVYIIAQNISFGPMKRHEQLASEGNLYGGQRPLVTTNNAPTRAYTTDFVVPISTVLITVFSVLFYTGYTASASFMQMLIHGDIAIALLLGSISGLAMGCILSLTRRTIHYTQLPYIIVRGMHMMLPSVLMLCLAWTLSALLTHDLHVGNYIAASLQSVLIPHMLPIIFLIISFGTTLAIGSSWGAIALMTSLALPLIVSIAPVMPPLALTDVPLLLPTLGAILSGALAANTLSPIADATIMASTSTATYHADHLQTQLQYSIPPLVGTCSAYVLFGLTGWSIASLVCGIIISLSMLWYKNER